MLEKPRRPHFKSLMSTRKMEALIRQVSFTGAKISILH